MRVTFNSQERTLREMTNLALTAGWKVVEVVLKPEGSLFGSIVAVPISVPPSSRLTVPTMDQEIDERCASPLVDTFYSITKLPTSCSMSGSPSNSAVTRIKQRIRKTLSRTFNRNAGPDEESPKDASGNKLQPAPLLPPLTFTTNSGSK
jgi:hypothetical protein